MSSANNFLLRLALLIYSLAFVKSEIISKLSSKLLIFVLMLFFSNNKVMLDLKTDIVSSALLNYLPESFS